MSESNTNNIDPKQALLLKAFQSEFENYEGTLRRGDPILDKIEEYFESTYFT